MSYSEDPMNSTNIIHIKRQVHNYTSELELKSLLIRIKNQQDDIGTLELNARINRTLKIWSKINDKKYQDADIRRERRALCYKIADKVVKDSEITQIDTNSHERFGEIILLMIKRILTKPQFSGYTYRDDFYSDAVYKIIKYLHNFNHNLISERTGRPVNAFAYISQYIHNSVLYIIIKKKKENDNLKDLVRSKNQGRGSTVKSMDIAIEHEAEIFEESNIINIELNGCKSIVKELKSILEEYKGKLGSPDGNAIHRLNVFYPSDYRISFDEYNELHPLLNENISIIRESQEITEGEK